MHKKKLIIDTSYYTEKKYYCQAFCQYFLTGFIS